MWVPKVAEDQDTNTRIGLALYACALLDAGSFVLMLMAGPLLGALACTAIIVGVEVLCAVGIWALADDLR
jgi:hypothetical protein